jgi:AbiV family abortive infection protein
MGNRQPLPTARQAVKGVTLASENAWTHIQCAEALQPTGHFGAASAHLVLAVEEAVKARVYYKWPALLRSMTQKQLRELLFTHQVRHEIAVHDSMSQPLRIAIALWHLDHPGRQMERKTLSRILARYSDAFPLMWAKNADKDKQRGMHSLPPCPLLCKIPGKANDCGFARRVGSLGQAGTNTDTAG